MSLTGGFDVVIQTTNQSLSSACARLHAEGLLSHRVCRSRGTELFDIVFGAPSLAAVTPQADSLTRIVAQTRVLVRARPLTEPTTVGRSAVAQIAFKARFEPTVPVGNQLSADDTIPIDWSETAASDIVVYTNDAGFEADASAALLEVMGEGTSFIPIGSFIAIGARGAVVCTIPVSGGGAAVAIGLDMGSGGGSATTIDHVMRYDWTIGLSRNYITTRAVQAFQQEFGGVPPPHGASAVEVEAKTTCVLDTPFGCLGTGVRRVLLNRLEIDLVAGRLILRGRLTQMTSGSLAFDVAADWSIDVTFQVDAAGTVQMFLGNPTVELVGPVAGAVDFLSGHQFQHAVQEALVSVLRPSLTASGPIEWVDGLIGGLGSAGGLGLRPVAIDVRSDGIALHGVVQGQQQPIAPVASATVIANPAQARALLLGAAASWSPGGDIAAVAWEPGDGTSLQSSGNGCRLAVEHLYSQAGTYTACLAVTDGGGRTSRDCAQIEVGILRYRLVSAKSRESSSAWEICAAPGETVSVDVAVAATQTAIPGVTVTVKGGNWSETGTTNAAGIARISIDVSRVQLSPAAGGSPPLFSLGGVDIEIDAPTWVVGGRRRVWLVDCAAAAVFKLEALKTRERWLERLAGYAELRRIRDQLNLAPSPPAGPRVPDDLPPIPWLDDRRESPNLDASSIGAAFAVLDQLTTFVALRPGDVLASALLGLSGHAEPNAALKRLDSLWEHLGTASTAFERESRRTNPPRDRK